MNASAADISSVKKEEGKGPADKVSLSLAVPLDLYEKIKLDSTLSKKPVGTLIEEWADKHVSPQDVSIGLATLMKNAPVREKPEPGVEMKALTVSVSRRHYNLIRMEALRQITTIRALLNGWIRENSREWHVMPVDQEKRREKVVAA